MLEQQDLQQIRKIMQEEIGSVLAVVNEGFTEMQKSHDNTNRRIDKLYSLVDGFIALHQKLDLELAALRTKVDRQEEELQKIKTKLAIA